jgi:hypothetical protein
MRTGLHRIAKGLQELTATVASTPSQTGADPIVISVEPLTSSPPMTLPPYASARR